MIEEINENKIGLPSIKLIRLLPVLSRKRKAEHTNYQYQKQKETLLHIPVIKKHKRIKINTL